MGQPSAVEIQIQGLREGIAGHLCSLLVAMHLEVKKNNLFLMYNRPAYVGFDIKGGSDLILNGREGLEGQDASMEKRWVGSFPGGKRQWREGENVPKRERDNPAELDVARTGV